MGMEIVIGIEIDCVLTYFTASESISDRGKKETNLPSIEQEKTSFTLCRYLHTHFIFNCSRSYKLRLAVHTE